MLHFNKINERWIYLKCQMVIMCLWMQNEILKKLSPMIVKSSNQKIVYCLLNSLLPISRVKISFIQLTCKFSIVLIKYTHINSTHGSDDSLCLNSWFINCDDLIEWIELDCMISVLWIFSKTKGFENIYWTNRLTSECHAM